MQRVWLCEDCDDAADSRIGNTKESAEKKLAAEFGYDDIAEAISDEWIKPAYEVELPVVVVQMLMRHQERTP